MAKTGLRQSKKAYLDYIELEKIIEDMGNAMRSAHMPYIAERGQFTPGQEIVWNRYVVYAMKQQ